jgi:hypothetical protein
VFIPALFTEKIDIPTIAEKNGKAVCAEIIHVKFARRYFDLGFSHLSLDQQLFMAA